MLLITRNVGENFVLVDNGKVIAKVVLVEISEKFDDQLKIGIDSPQDIKIYRSEIWNKIKAGRVKGS